MDKNVIERAARAAHEANRVYCEALGDDSQVAWESAPEWQRQSARRGVEFIMENPSALPSFQHESWLEEKNAAGWTYGPVKDAEKKEHPCFVPYEELPESQKAKDTIFGAVVRGVLAHAGGG
jgi:hypothetical protein